MPSRFKMIKDKILAPNSNHLLLHFVHIRSFGRMAFSENISWISILEYFNNLNKSKDKKLCLLVLRKSTYRKN